MGGVCRQPVAQNWRLLGVLWSGGLAVEKLTVKNDDLEWYGHALDVIRPLKAERTGWYSIAVKPARVGWYEVKLSASSNEIRRRYWNGMDWVMMPSLMARSYYPTGRGFWRGLKQPYWKG